MLNGNEAASALGLSVKNFSILSRREGFPHTIIEGKRFYDDPPEPQRRWIEQNIKSKASLRPSGGPSFPPTVPAKADGSAGGDGSSLFRDDDPSILALESQTGSAVSISRSVLNLASRDLARRFKRGVVGATQLDALNKTLARLVAVEADALDTAERMGLLMHRDEVERVVGVLADRFIRAFGRLEAEIATEALLWRKMEGMPADQYSRKVREFVQKHAREIRTMEAAEIEAITKKEN